MRLGVKNWTDSPCCLLGLVWPAGFESGFGFEAVGFGFKKKGVDSDSAGFGFEVPGFGSGFEMSGFEMSRFAPHWYTSQCTINSKHIQLWTYSTSTSGPILGLFYRTIIVNLG